MDFDTLNAAATFPIVLFNPEVIFHCTMISFTSTSFNKAVADSNLYSSYDTNDLRKVIFYKNFSGALRIWGSYSKVTTNFCGLATDEMFLIRAEANARKGNLNNALNDLNTLPSKRYNSNSFIPVTATTADSALTKILIERKKELVFRSLRWSDLRRLNKDPKYAVTLSKTINGQTYTLQPNDPKYVFPIPPDEIRLSGIQQNPR